MKRVTIQYRYFDDSVCARCIDTELEFFAATCASISRYLSGLDFVETATYRKSVTSVSLVNKSNQDPDVQIADALAPIAGMLLSEEATRSEKYELFRKFSLENRKAGHGYPHI